MIRSSALYISLIVSLLILMICGGMLLIGYTYRMQDRKQERMLRLRRNLDSGRELLLLQTFKADTSMRISLFADADPAFADSLAMEKRHWGLYELGTVRTWQAGDTLSKSFLMAAEVEDTLQVFYLADEDRPVSISGKSKISGTAYLPKSGVRAAYVEGTGYLRDTLIYGQQKGSNSKLPPLNASLVAYLGILQDTKDVLESTIPSSISRSFSNSIGRIHRKKEFKLPKGFEAIGQVILSSDSLVEITAGSMLDQVLVVAPTVKIHKGFEGNIQVFASESIIIADSVKLNYPSALIVLQPDTAHIQAKLSIGNDVQISGQVVAFRNRGKLTMPIITLGQHSIMRGEIWSNGYACLKRNSSVVGTVSAVRLLAQLPSGIYENYLIDVTLNRPALSRYYLSSRLIQSSKTKNKVLCWLN